MRYTEILVCPRDRKELTESGRGLECADGHVYPVIDGIPIMLIGEAAPTHRYMTNTLAQVLEPPSHRAPVSKGTIDPFVRDELVGSCGRLYSSARRTMGRYPIPDLRLPPGDGKTLLDVGSNWGRWSLSAARAGYRSIGLDPSLDAVRAGKRVAKELDLNVTFVVGDARFLPFAPATFDVSFAYSVLQHFSKSDARRSWSEMDGVTKSGGAILVQLPNRHGLLQTLNRFRQRAANDSALFRIRYWTLEEMRGVASAFGETEFEIDGFFSLNPQPADIDLLPLPQSLVVRASEVLRVAGTKVPALIRMADSILVRTRRR